jgi:hypothetical protein
MFMLATLQKLQLAALNVPFVYTVLCSGQCIRDCVE